MSGYGEVCENCAVGDEDDDSVQLRDCGHTLCEKCCGPECPLCLEDEASGV